MRKSTDDVLGVLALHFVKLAIVDDAPDHLVHVVRLVRVVGNNIEQRLVTPVARVGRRSARRIREIVRRDEAEQIANPLKALRLRVKGEVCYARLGRMSVGAPQVLHRHVFVGDGLNDVGPRHEHVRCATHHIREVGDRRRINGAAGAGAEHRRDLRNYTGSKRIAKEDLRVAAERDDAFLDTRATRVVETDDRRAVANGEIHDLHDLLGERFRQRSAEYREILGEDINESTFDLPVAGDDAVAVEFLRIEAEVDRSVENEPIQLDKTSFVQKELQPFAGGELTFFMLCL